MSLPPLLTRIEAARRRLPANVRKLGWISLANDAASELAYPIVPLFLTVTLGAPVAIVGLIEGIAEAMATGVRLLSGWVSDRMGDRRKPWIIGGYGASTAARAMLAAAPGWGLVLAGRIVDRLGKGARSTPRDALISDSTPAELRGSSFGYHRAMDTAGAVLGPLLAVILLENGVALRGILWVAAGLGVVTLIVLRGVREAPGHDPARAAAAVAERDALPPVFWGAIAVWVLFSLGNSSDAFLVLRARDLGLGVVVVVLAYAVYNVIYCSLSWPFGALSDRVPRSLLLGGGLAMFALVYFGFAITSHGWTVWPLFAVYGVYIAATEGVARAWIADTLPNRAAVGTAYGIFFLATAAASLVASVVAGVLWTYVSPRAPFVVGAAAAVLALVVLVGLEFGWQARARTIKLGLLGAGAVVLAGSALAVTFEHHRLAEAFRTAEAEPLPAAFVRPCDAAPTARAQVAFPAAGSTYTQRSLEGPTTVVSGFRAGVLKDANAAFQTALAAAGYTILRSEIDPADSEVVFRNATTAGQVAMTQECRSRVRLRITIRPA
ncbi:MAG TPA: MFS transporter [Gaiellaceae bacterium]|nr:MFS transporter [Gaiellaceae bacterium]